MGLFREGRVGAVGFRARLLAACALAAVAMAQECRENVDCPEPRSCNYCGGGSLQGPPGECLALQPGTSCGQCGDCNANGDCQVKSNKDPVCCVEDPGFGSLVFKINGETCGGCGICFEGKCIKRASGKKGGPFFSQECCAVDPNTGKFELQTGIRGSCGDCGRCDNGLCTKDTSPFPDAEGNPCCVGTPDTTFALEAEGSLCGDCGECQTNGLCFRGTSASGNEFSFYCCGTIPPNVRVGQDFQDGSECGECGICSEGGCLLAEGASGSCCELAQNGNAFIYKEGTCGECGICESGVCVPDPDTSTICCQQDIQDLTFKYVSGECGDCGACVNGACEIATLPLGAYSEICCRPDIESQPNVFNPVEGPCGNCSTCVSGECERDKSTSRFCCRGEKGLVNSEDSFNLRPGEACGNCGICDGEGLCQLIDGASDSCCDGFETGQFQFQEGSCGDCGTCESGACVAGPGTSTSCCGQDGIFNNAGGGACGDCGECVDGACEIATLPLGAYSENCCQPDSGGNVFNFAEGPCGGCGSCAFGECEDDFACAVGGPGGLTALLRYLRSSNGT